MSEQLIDHLFRHHYGKMVSILTRIFGLSNLETIEDALQDTFIKASISWRNQIPENPEAWLTKAAKNRVLDIFRQIKSSKNRENIVISSAEAMAMTELFLDTEIDDSQLRMIFTACHPKLKSVEQIAFALKTVSGFSSKEIASALLTKEETIKKRLSRARKTIKEQEIAFEIPLGKELPKRLDTVLEVLYLIFNEGFHSNKQTILIRKEVCGEAMRLIQLILKNKTIRNGKTYALFALMCFHAARIDSKLNLSNEIVDLKNQDRSKWFFPLIELGNSSMIKAVGDNLFSIYHYEAAIASEHIKATTFETTNWKKIFEWYEKLQAIHSSPMHLLNMVIVQIQLKNVTMAQKILDTIKASDFGQRQYLFYGTASELYTLKGDILKSIENIDKALELVSNENERTYLQKKKNTLLSVN